MMGALLCVLLCALGHLTRDGYPALGSTQAARALGGLLCVMGSFLLSPDWHGVIIGGTVYLGFYADIEHGEGHQARGWIDVPPLIVSGMTSLAPLVLAVGTKAISLNGTIMTIAFDLTAIAILLTGLLKPVIWFVWWHAPVRWSGDPEGLWVPTRAAAVTWGAVVAIAIIFNHFLRSM